MKRVLVATTTCGYKAKDGEELDWLHNARELRNEAASEGCSVDFFATIETGQGFDAEFDRLLLELHGLGGEWWTFQLRDRIAELDGSTRLAHICTGRNLIHEYAIRKIYDAVLFVDSDVRIPDDSIPRLLELNHLLVGGNIETYCLSGSMVPPQVDWNPTWDVREHWTSAGFLMVGLELIRALRWRWDPFTGTTDDPSFAADALRLGYPTWVRHDLVGHHHRPSLPPVEQRGHDLRVPSDDGLNGPDSDLVSLVGRQTKLDAVQAQLAEMRKDAGTLVANLLPFLQGLKLEKEDAEDAAALSSFARELSARFRAVPPV